MKTTLLDLISEGQLAARTGIPRATLGYLRRTAGLPFVQVSDRVIRYQPGEVVEWLEARHQGGEVA